MPAEDGRGLPTENNIEGQAKSSGWPPWPPPDPAMLLDVGMHGWSFYASPDQPEEQQDEAG